MMFDDKYSLQPLFPYADGLYMILPAGLPDRFYSGKGEHITVENEVICFKPGTSPEIINRLVSEYSEQKNQQNESGVYGD